MSAKGTYIKQSTYIIPQFSKFGIKSSDRYIMHSFNSILIALISYIFIAKNIIK